MLHTVVAVYIAIAQFGYTAAREAGLGGFLAAYIGLIFPFGVLFGTFHAVVAIGETFIPWLRKRNSTAN